MYVIMVQTDSYPAYIYSKREEECLPMSYFAACDLKLELEEEFPNTTFTLFKLIADEEE